MFTIIDQQKKLFLNMVEAGLQSPQETTSIPSESQEKQEEVPNYDAILKEFQRAISEYKNKENLTPEDKARILEAKALADRQISDHTQLSLAQQRELHRVHGSIIQQTTLLLNDFKSKQTQEKNTGIESNLFRGNENRAQIIASLSSSSKNSLGEILKSQNLVDLTTQLKSQAPRSKDGYKFTYFAGISNYSDLSKTLKNAGYQPDGAFGDIEAYAVFSTLLDYVETQNKIPKLNDQQKLQILVDFDKNGVLESNLNFSIGERQAAFISYESLQGDQIDTLVKNLGLAENMQEFSSKMSSNLYLAREQFQRVLGTYLERGVKMGELLQQNGKQHALERMYREDSEISKQIDTKIDELLNSDERLNNELSKLENQDDIANVKKAIRLEAVGAALGISKGIGASFDISAFTKNFVDSLQVGIINGVPGVAFSKKIFDKNGWQGGVGLSNFVIPFAGVVKTFKRDQKLEQLFDTQVKGKFQPSIYATGALGVGTAVGISIEKPNENNSAGIENMVYDMAKKFDQITSGEYQISNLEEQMIVVEIQYAVLLIEQTIDGKGGKEQALHDLKNGYLAYYENMLMRNAAGSKITSVGVGLAGLSGYNWIPYLTVGGEKISQNYQRVNARIEDERLSTHRALSPDQVGLTYETLNGKNVYSIDESEYMYQISTGDGKVQAQRQGGKLYFSGDISSIKIDEHATSDGVIRTIVIGDGQITSQGMYLGAKFENIQTSTLNVLSGNMESAFEQVSENTQRMRNDIFNLLDTRAGKSPNTPGLTALQVAIYELKAGKGNHSIQGVWEQFNKTFASFKGEYANNYTSAKHYPEIQNFTDAEKVLILQSIPAALMKKDALQVNNNQEITLKNQTISQYDTQGREKYFDGLFEKNTLSLLPSVQQARQEWLQVNGNSENYTLKSINDGSVAFSGTQIGGTISQPVQDVLMPYTGVYNIASVEGGKDFISIPGKNSEVVKLLPTTYLKSIQMYLETYGISLQNTTDVQTFLNSDQVSYELAFAKMGECLNDSIILKNLKISGAISPSTMPQSIPLGATLSSTVYTQENKVVQAGIIVSENRDNYKKDRPDNQSSTPDVGGDTPEDGGGDGEPEDQGGGGRG